ncbi:MAG: nickel pincer cofactor biosynthesis protein LarC [Deltaproteobacteria bacterium]|nr:nickel pincer cofactor biosynthesis protein LarC [Deltaproteobacteria bacterium]
MAHEGHEHDEHEHEHAPTPADPASAASFLGLPPFASCRRVLHVDPIGGAAGDMLVAAFLDLDVPIEVVERAVAATGLTGFRLEVGRRDKHAIAARAFEVIVEGEPPARDYSVIARMLAEAPLDERVRTLAARAFLRLGEAEAKIHRQPLSRVHFHEVGGVDAIVDVVGASAALAYVEAAAGGEGALGVSIGPLPVGGGTARGAHGAIPVPAPAALELLIGLPVRDPGFAGGVGGELVTPTGAALLRAFSELLPASLGRWPAFVPQRIGYGAGKKDLADRPNVVRLVVGETSAFSGAGGAGSASTASTGATHVVLEANVDDATGEVAATAIEALLEAGALDAWAQPITMKKGRPAVTIAALCDVARGELISRALLAHTGSLGVRRSEVTRVERPRRFVEIVTAYGAVRVKIADGDGLPIVVHPELEDCRARAKEHGVPVREVIRAAIVAIR